MACVSLSLLVLKSRQMEKLRDFYTVLGLQFKEEQHGSGPEHYSVQLDSVVLEIYPGDDPVSSSLRIGFAVDNLKSVLESLNRIEASLISKPKDSPWGLRAVVRDPDGRSVELTQKK